MAEGRAYGHRVFWIILLPGAFLAATVLAVGCQTFSR
jgi:ABC-type dipeptide/oligopeptide/nickel transport system permease subunit